MISPPPLLQCSIYWIIMFVPSDVSIYNVTEPTVTTGSSLPLLGIFVSLGNHSFIRTLYFWFNVFDYARKVYNMVFDICMYNFMIVIDSLPSVAMILNFNIIKLIIFWVFQIRVVVWNRRLYSWGFFLSYVGPYFIKHTFCSFLISLLIPNHINIVWLGIIQLFFSGRFSLKLFCKRIGQR